MRSFVSSSRVLRPALFVAALLAAGPVPAQTQPPAGTPGAGAGAPPKTGRSISATGRTMPQPRGTGQAAASGDAEMSKAQKAAEARSKAWDSKMHKTMSTICNGC